MAGGGAAGGGPPPAPAPPAAPGIPPAGGAPVAGPNPDRYLDASIRKVIHRAPGVFPMSALSPPHAGRGWPGGFQALIRVAGAVPPVPGDVNALKQLLTALASVDGNGSYAAKATVDQTTVRMYRQMNAGQKLAFIDAAWDLAAVPHHFNTLAQNMLVPGPVPATAADSLPSSWCPDPKSPGNYARRSGAGTGLDAWAGYTVGFRIDGTDDNAITRVTTAGMTLQVMNDTFMQNFRGQYVIGTTARNAATPRFWSESHDIWNESAVCVSRNLFGATAFPLRETVTDGLGTNASYSILWAVDCRGLVGLDTEAVQNGLPGARVWRPGEKAFPAIPPNRMIGYVKILRRGAPAAGGWNFTIPNGSFWTRTGGGNKRQIKYIGKELGAWHGNHTIPAAYDFA